MRFIDVAVAEPIVAIFLFLLGVYVLGVSRSSRITNVAQHVPIPRAFLSPLGVKRVFSTRLAAGVRLHPTLLSPEREPRSHGRSTQRVHIALLASIGFPLSLSFAQVPWEVVGVLLSGVWSPLR